MIVSVQVLQVQLGLQVVFDSETQVQDPVEAQADLNLNLDAA
jgi:hypothetical protein